MLKCFRVEVLSLSFFLIACGSSQEITPTPVERAETATQMSDDQRRMFELVLVKNYEGASGGSAADPNKMVVQRSIFDYEKQYQTHKIVIFKTHDGPDGGVYGAGQGPEYYMVDEIWGGPFGEKADLMINANHLASWKYIPDDWADEIVADDRFLHTPAILFLVHKLKKGGKIIFRGGGSLGFPSFSISGQSTHSRAIVDSMISEDGRYASFNHPDRAAFPDGQSYMLETGRRRQEARDWARERAEAYFTARGYATVELNEASEYVLTK